MSKQAAAAETQAFGGRSSDEATATTRLAPCSSVRQRTRMGGKETAVASRLVLTALLMLGLGVALPSQAQSTAASPGSRIQAANDQLLNRGNLGRVEEFFSAD